MLINPAPSAIIRPPHRAGYTGGRGAIFDRSADGIIGKVTTALVKSNLIRILQTLLILALPFGIFYWMSPIGDLSVGNDYVTFSIDHQLALQHALERGTFPLYAPGFAGGHSAAALTLGQLHHPLPHLASLLPGYWDGRPLEANTLLKLAAIGLTHLVLFALLIRLKLRGIPAFIISFVTVYNLRMLDMYRYGASLENHLAFLLLVGALALYYSRPTRIAGPALIIASTYLLVTGGHPQIMYLGLLGAGAIGLLIPFAVQAILPGDAREGCAAAKRFYLAAGVCLGAGILLASVYTLPFYVEFIKENSARVSRDYKWSLAYSDSWSGVLNSFFRPLYSNVHGAFGGASIILLAPLCPLVAALRRPVPKVVHLLFGVALVVFLISLGGETPAHLLFWKLVPLADSFRTPGRINMILAPVFLFLLAWLFRSAPSDAGRRFFLPRPISPALLVSVLGLAIYVVYNVFIIKRLPPPTHYHPANINQHTHQITLFVYWTGLAALILAPLYFGIRHRRIRPLIGLLLSLTVLAQTGAALRWGTWIVPKRTKITRAQIDNRMKNDLKVAGLAGFGMESPPVAEQIRRAALDPEMARFYRSYHTVKDNEAAYAYMARDRRSTEAVVVAPGRPSKSADCPSADIGCGADEVALVYSSYNKVSFDVSAVEDGLFTLSLPFTHRWSAVVGDTPVETHRANGYLLGLFVSKGEHTVTLRYSSPATQAGLAISLAALFGVVLALGRRLQGRLLRFGVPIAVAAAALAAYGLWQHSLYSGDNLNTRYTWRSDAFSPPDNLAFGRTATMTGIRSTERPYDYYAGKAVDGDRRGAGFSTGKNRKNPFWQVDLGRVVPVNRVVIYHRDGLTKHLPLEIKTSSDGKAFATAERVTERPEAHIVTIDLGGTTTRFVRLQASGSDPFSLKEVEVYGELD